MNVWKKKSKRKEKGERIEDGKVARVARCKVVREGPLLLNETQRHVPVLFLNPPSSLSFSSIPFLPHFSHFPPFQNPNQSSLSVHSLSSSSIRSLPQSQSQNQNQNY
ncbi:hypothetical protein RJT34_31012 [Clitoria ternatea]|uniref:Uncharacterized protein n=1 Tax=Clitoria ternatea TaxID=43366 RepID=A0AAN9I2J2_CLITE